MGSNHEKIKHKRREGAKIKAFVSPASVPFRAFYFFYCGIGQYNEENFADGTALFFRREEYTLILSDVCVWETSFGGAPIENRQRTRRLKSRLTPLSAGHCTMQTPYGKISDHKKILFEKIRRKT